MFRGEILRSAAIFSPLRHDGLVAPCVLDGAVNGELFVAYVQQVLVPTLKAGTSSSWTIFLHKVAGVREAIEAAGAHLRLLPP